MLAIVKKKFQKQDQKQENMVGFPTFWYKNIKFYKQIFTLFIEFFLKICMKTFQ